ncbi:MAG: hypothetical protein QMD85_02000 [Candidatus Aenigmarchaeota archaeon]|nr:hypothetical protein [Candidatus Aenigmarchaeota archaeon]MDI6722322.1 hypothetical protein [Candidatus Aenigmarchaeota archaeon]
MDEKMDRVRFIKYGGSYFSGRPESPFLVYDRCLTEEEPENYRLYTDLSADTLIVKAGTSIVSHRQKERQKYNLRFISHDLADIRKERGMNVLLITSGAIGLGRAARLKSGEKIRNGESPEQKRTDAIKGQPLLYRLWQSCFNDCDQYTNEKLVTHEDILDDRRSEYLMDEYQRWLSRGIIPVINEDDAASLEEIDTMLKGEKVFRDNDSLASLHAQLLKKGGYKPLLVMLSNTDGIYTSESFRNHEYTPIRIVKDSTGLEEHALDISSSRGRGGMVSKIDAARNAARSCVHTVIANGQYCNHDSAYQKGREGSRRKYDVLHSILDKKVVGTRFTPESSA